MKTSKFNEAQIAYILRQAEDGTAIGEVCRSAGISEATFYNWRKKYGGLLPSEMKRLKQLEEENVKLVNRLFREMSLQLRNKSPKRKVKAKLREGREAPAARNDVWAMDFDHVQLFDATKVRVLTILDAFTMFSPAIVPRLNWRGTGVVEVLVRVCKEVGFPRTIRVDQGPEFISKDLDLWAYRRGVILDYSRPGKPTDNAFIESPNRKFRMECLNVHWFTSLDEMRRICEDWRRDYNEVRPHSAIGNKTPMSLMNCSEAHGPV